MARGTSSSERKIWRLFCAIQQRRVAAKDSIELVLEASKKAIPDSIEKLRVYEKMMRNYLDMHERSTFSPKGSSEDKNLKAWIENMQTAGAERSFPNLTTAANANKSMRILMRSRAQFRVGTKLTLSTVS